MESFLARGLYIACKPQSGEQVPKDQRHPGTIQNVCLIAGVQIKDHGIGRLRGIGPGQRHMQFKGRKVLHPDQRFQIVDQADRHLLPVILGTSAVFTQDGR